MLDIANDIRALSDFRRNTLELLERFRETGHPLVPTVNGKAELVVQDAAGLNRKQVQAVIGFAARSLDLAPSEPWSAGPVRS